MGKVRHSLLIATGLLACAASARADEAVKVLETTCASANSPPSVSIG